MACEDRVCSRNRISIGVAILVFTLMVFFGAASQGTDWVGLDPDESEEELAAEHPRDSAGSTFPLNEQVRLGLREPLLDFAIIAWARNNVGLSGTVDLNDISKAGFLPIWCRSPSIQAL